MTTKTKYVRTFGANDRMPAYTNKRKLADGRWAYFWIRPAWANPDRVKSPDAKTRAKALRHGRTCPVESSPLGPVQSEAYAKAEALNEAFKEWREGTESKAVPGSVHWVFAWYREQPKFKDKLAFKTRKGYQEAMDAICEMAMKSGKVGQRQAATLDGPVADKLYEKAKAKHGERQGTYMMQVARLVWNHAMRPGYSKHTGVKHNPFTGMGLSASSGKGKGNVAATREQYDAYRAAAHALKLPSMAVAAALCFECCQRVWDVFGIEDPDGRKTPGIFWHGYTPGEEIMLVQSKTGKEIRLPLSITVGGETVRLYPELEDELAATPRTGSPNEMIVRREFDGKPYPIDFYPKAHKRVREKAKLPKEIRFTSFRHGGLTEIGNADVSDMRAVSGHSKLDTTAIYNKANIEKARMIAAKRREHIALITAGEKEGDRDD